MGVRLAFRRSASFAWLIFFPGGISLLMINLRIFWFSDSVVFTVLFFEYAFLTVKNEFDLVEDYSFRRISVKLPIS